MSGDRKKQLGRSTSPIPASDADTSITTHTAMQVCLFCTKRLDPENKKIRNDVESDGSKITDKENLCIYKDLDQQLKLIQLVFRYLNVKQISIEENSADDAILVDIGEDVGTPRSLSLPFCQTCRLATGQLAKLQDQMDEISLKIGKTVEDIQGTILESNSNEDEAMESYYTRLREFKEALINRDSPETPNEVENLSPDKVENSSPDRGANLSPGKIKVNPIPEELDFGDLVVINSYEEISTSTNTADPNPFHASASSPIPSSPHMDMEQSELDSADDSGDFFFDGSMDQQESSRERDSSKESPIKSKKENSSINVENSIEASTASNSTTNISLTDKSIHPHPQQPIQVIIIHEKSKRVNCRHCGETLKNRLALLSHIQKLHHSRVTNPKNTSATVIKVEARRPVANTSRWPVNNSSTVTLPSVNKCATCDKGFVHNTALKNHERVHNGLPLYTCHICQKFHTREQSFLKHLNGHEKWKSFMCDQCGKRLSSEADLLAHTKRHQGIDLKYQCEVDWCRKKFLKKASLKSHAKYHAKIPLERLRYGCDICGSWKRFLSRAGLNLHMKNAHNQEKPDGRRKQKLRQSSTDDEKLDDTIDVKNNDVPVPVKFIRITRIRAKKQPDILSPESELDEDPIGRNSSEGTNQASPESKKIGTRKSQRPAKGIIRDDFINY